MNAIWIAPHPSVYVQEEMDERHWDRDILAYMMVAGVSNTREALKWFNERPRDEWAKNWSHTRLALDLFFEVGPTDPNLLMGDDAVRLAKAFGTSDEFFANLEREWRRQQAVAKDSDGTERGS